MGSRNVIIVFGATVATLARCRRAMAGRPSSWKWILLATEIPTESDELRRWSTHSGLHTAILLLDREAAHDPTSSIHLHIDRFIQRARSVGFGLFVHADSGVFDEPALGASLAALREAVQIPEQRSLADTLDDAEAFAARVGSIRFAAALERLRISGSAGLGSLAAIAQVSATGLVVLFSIAGLVWPGYRAFVVSRADPRLLGTLAGLPLLPAIYPSLFLMFSRGVSLIYSIAAFLLMCALVHGSLDLFLAISAPWGWFAFGQATGFLLDGMRRNGRRTGWLLKVVQNSYAHAGLPTGRTRRLPRESRLPLRRFIPDVLIVPWFRTVTPAVFLSYTRNSEWGRTLAQDIHTACKTHRVPTFYAPESIGAGTPWRRSLFRRLGDCNAFIGIVDVETAQQEWPAREIEVALQGHARTGLPRLVILIPENVAGFQDTASREGAGADVGAYPIFSDALARLVEMRRIGDLLAITVPSRDSGRQDVIESLMWGLDLKRFATPGLLPRRLTNHGDLLVVGAAHVASLGMLAGALEVGAIVLNYAIGTPIFDRVVSYHGLAISLALAYTIGFAGRLALSEGLEVEENPRLARLWPMIALVGLGYWFLTTAGQQTALTLAWSGIVGAAGWWLSDYMTSRVKRSSPTLFRREDSKAESLGQADIATARKWRQADVASFTAFMKGKELYERYLQHHHINFEMLTTGQSANAKGDVTLQEAATHYAHALEQSLQLDARHNAASAQVQLGLLAQLQGEPERAERLYQEALTTLEALPLEFVPRFTGAILTTEAVCFTQLGLLRLDGGRHQEARTLFERALTACTDGTSVIPRFNEARARRLLTLCDDLSRDRGMP